MEEEMHALLNKGTWEFVDLLQGTDVVGRHQVFFIKYHLDGTIGQMKAWLITKGYAQTYGVNYFETLPCCSS